MTSLFGLPKMVAMVTVFFFRYEFPKDRKDKKSISLQFTPPLFLDRQSIDKHYRFWIEKKSISFNSFSERGREREIALIKWKRERNDYDLNDVLDEDDGDDDDDQAIIDVNDYRENFFWWCNQKKTTKYSSFCFFFVFLGDSKKPC